MKDTPGWGKRACIKTLTKYYFISYYTRNYQSTLSFKLRKFSNLGFLKIVKSLIFCRKNNLETRFMAQTNN